MSGYEEYETEEFLDEDDDYLDAATTPYGATSSGVLALNQILYAEHEETFDAASIFGFLEQLARSVADMNHLSLSASMVLLQRYRWQTEQLNEKYFENPSAVLADEHLTEVIATHENTLVPNDADALCEVCQSDLAPGEGLHLSSCGDTACTACWRDLVTYKLSRGEKLLQMRCLGDGCEEMVGLKATLSLFAKPEDQATNNAIRRNYVSGFVEVSPQLRWCPAPRGCEGVIVLPKLMPSEQTVQCHLCHHEFCFHCGRPAHAPANCEEMRIWQEKVDKDGHSIALVLSTTKACPQCHSRIEKNQGCNHMTCKCKYEFCWICLQKWSEHRNGDYYSCKNGKNAMGSPENSEVDYMHFNYHYEHYKSQLDSRQREESSIERILSGVESHVIDSTTLIESHGTPVALHTLNTLMQTLRRALHDARTVLSQCYVKTYPYPEKDLDQLFLHKRGSLEESTEALSMFLTRMFTSSPCEEADVRDAMGKVSQWTQLLLSTS